MLGTQGQVEELYSLWRKSLDDRHGEMPNPKSLVTEYEKAVREQFGIPTPEHKLLIFRCVWEELDANLLPETRQEDKRAVKEFQTFYWKQDCSLHLFTHKYMQLLGTVIMHRGRDYMTDEELGDQSECAS